MPNIIRVPIRVTRVTIRALTISSGLTMLIQYA